MPKVPPEERWKRDGRERYEAFRRCQDLPRLRRRGLAVLGRQHLLSSEDWWDTSKAALRSEAYRHFQRECRETGDRFGLAQWTVEMACLLVDYDPDREPHVLEAEWPGLRVVTEFNDDLFLSWLLYEARQIGLHVDYQQGSVRMPIICVPFPVQPEKRLSLDRRPPRARAFQVLPKIPPGYPPEAAAQLGRKAAQLQRELARRLGYNVPQRMRGSALAARASELRIGEEPLPPGGVYEIMDDVYEHQDLGQDQKRRGRVKSQRHRVKKRFQDRLGLA